MLRALLLWGTTGYTGASPVPTWGNRIEFRLNNEQFGYSATDFDTLHTLHAVLNQRQVLGNEYHTHRTDSTAASAVQKGGRPIEQGMNGWQNYAFMPFDLDWSDDYAVETAGSSLVALRTNALSADAARVLMVERVPVSEFGVASS
jgi:hypothetical protein